MRQKLKDRLERNLRTAEDHLRLCFDVLAENQLDRENRPEMRRAICICVESLTMALDRVMDDIDANPIGNFLATPADAQ